MSERARMPDEEGPREEGLWIAALLDGSGGMREIDWDAVERWRPEDGALWIHLDPRSPRVLAWLHEASGLSPSDVEELLSEPPQSRVTQLGVPVLISLFGLQSELDESQVGAADIWAEPQRAITLFRGPIPLVARIRGLAREGRAPTDIGSLLLLAGENHGALILDGVLDLEPPMAELEYVVNVDQEAPEAQMRELERRVALMGRLLAPWAVLLARVDRMGDAWFVRDHKDRWHRLSEDARDAGQLLQSLHDRARAVHQTIGEQLTRRTNRFLYFLTVISAVLLPLTLITGIFGMNVGIQGASFPQMEGVAAFVAVCASLALLAWAEFRIIKRLDLW